MRSHGPEIATPRLAAFALILSLVPAATSLSEVTPIPDLHFSGYLRATHSVCLSADVGDSLDAFGTVVASDSPAIADPVAHHPGAEFTFIITGMTVSERSHIEWYPAHGVYDSRYTPGIVTILMDTSPDASDYDPVTFRDGEVVLAGNLSSVWFSAQYSNGVWGLSSGAQMLTTSGELQEHFKDEAGLPYTVNASGIWMFTYGSSTAYPYSGAIDLYLAHEADTPVKETTWGSIKALWEH